MSTVKRGLPVFLMLLIAACTNPTEDLSIVIDTNVIKYTAAIYVTDGTNGGPAPSGASVAVSGEAAAHIYDISGDKDIRLTNGMVTIGLGPDTTPQQGQPITISVTVKASGYNTVTRQINFKAEEKQQLVSISLVRAGSSQPPVVLPPPTVYSPVSLSFIGKCSSRSDLQIRPSLYVFFREAGSNTSFRYMGYMDKGNITTSYLGQGKTYEFQIAFGGETYVVSQKIEQPAYNLTVDMGTACNKY